MTPKSSKAIPAPKVGPSEGRGPEGDRLKRQDPVTALRLPAGLRENVDVWAAQQPDKPGRSEAIRRLVQKGLASAQPARPRGNEAASKASKMAGKEIDRRADRSAPIAEQESRKRRLLKGPKEFRDIRRDRSKTKR
jgi:hypothetical protein